MNLLTHQEPYNHLNRSILIIGIISVICLMVYVSKKGRGWW